MKNNVITPEHPIIIGKIGGVYGILGWIKIISFTDKSVDIFNYDPWFIYLKFVWELIYLEQWKLLRKRYIAKIRNISNRESAKLFMHCDIVTEETRLPYLRYDEYYCKDLIGCAVITIQKMYIGHVFKIIETTANDVLIVKIYNKDNFYRKKECFIPFIQNKVIKNVNINDRIIVVDWDINF